MTERATLWIADASPLITLAKAGLLDLLTAPGRRIWITNTVCREVEDGSPTDPARQALAGGWGERQSDPPIPAALADRHLDRGEEATLALALLHPGARVVIDDGDGRRTARALGLPLIGTIGVAAEARHAGRIPRLAPVLHTLAEAGLYLPHPDILRPTLAAFGEQWP